jgi:hypothetical protein
VRAGAGSPHAATVVKAQATAMKRAERMGAPPCNRRAGDGGLASLGYGRRGVPRCADHDGARRTMITSINVKPRRPVRSDRLRCPGYTLPYTAYKIALFGEQVVVGS